LSNMHQFAIYIEHMVRQLLGGNSQRYALGGLVDADFIEAGGMVTTMAIGLSTRYWYDHKEIIDRFLGSIIDLNGKGFQEIGLERIEQVYDDFQRLVDVVM
jgi:hypothetical protein